MSKYITHEEAGKIFSQAVAEKQLQKYANSVDGKIKQSAYDFLSKKAGVDTITSDISALANRIDDTQKKAQRKQYIDSKDYDQLISDTETMQKRLGYYNTFLNKYAPDQSDAIKGVGEMSKNLGSAIEILGQQRDVYRDFENNANGDSSIQSQWDNAVKEGERQNYLLFEYDMEAGKEALDAADAEEKYALEQFEHYALLAEDRQGKAADNMTYPYQEDRDKFAQEAAEAEKLRDEWDKKVGVASKAAEKLREEYELAKWLREDYEYSELAKNEDYEKESKKADSTWDFSKTGRTADYINGKWYAEVEHAIREFKDFINLFDNDETVDTYNRYDHMTDDQVNMFNYIYNTKGKKAAKKYLDHISGELQQKYGKANKSNNWFVNAGRALSGGVENMGENILNLAAGTIGEVSKIFGGENVVSKGADKYIKENAAISNKDLALLARKEDAGAIEKISYDLLGSLPSSAVTMVPGGFAIAALSAAGGAYTEATVEGKNSLQRIFMAIGEGSMEYLTNKLLNFAGGSKAEEFIKNATQNMGGTVGKTLSKNFIRYGFGALSEGIEEAVQEVWGTGLRNFVYGENETVKLSDLVYAGLLGAASAGMLSGGKTAYNIYKDFKLPETTEKSYKETFDTAPKGASTSERFKTFTDKFSIQDTIVSADIIMNVENGDNDAAYKIIDDTINGYKYAKEYNKRNIGGDSSVFDTKILQLETMKNLIKSGKFNTEAAKTATMQNTSIWQVAAENNDVVANALLQDGLSNTQIEKTVLKDKITVNAFKRLTGTDLSKYKTVSQKRNAVKVAAEAYKAFAGSDAAKQVSDILKANNTISDANVRSANRIKAQDILTAAYKVAASEDQTARQNGDRHATDVAQAKMKLIDALKNDVRNGKVLSFASLDGSVAINNASKPRSAAKTGSTQSAERAVASSNDGKMAIESDLSAAREGINEEYVNMLESVGEGETYESLSDAKKAVLENLDEKIEKAEGDEKAELIEQKKKVEEYISLLDAREAEVNDLIKQMGREEFNKRTKRHKEVLKKNGIDLDIDHGGELYFDEDGKPITEEEYDKLKSEGKKPKIVFQNGYNTANTIKIFESIAFGRSIKTLDPETGEIISLRSGIDISAREAVDFVIGHETIHAGVKAGSDIVSSIINYISNTKIDTYYELGKRRAGKKVSAEADAHWNALKELYVKAEMAQDPELTREQAQAKVNDAYIYEEIAADYMGMLMSQTGMLDRIASKGGIVSKIKLAAKALISKLTGNKLDIRAERVKALMKKLDAAAKSTYGSLAKTANVTENAQKSTESDKSTEGEQTVTEGEKGAENEKRMMVVGEGAETANYSELVKAKAMLKANPNADTVSETGWWLGKDGKWRYEISDKKMKFRREGFIKNPKTLGDYVKHDKLFGAYPWLRDVRVEIVDSIGDNPRLAASYNEDTDTISIRNSVKDAEAIKKDLIHEIQHAVQKFEGFKGGSNPNNAAFYLLEMYYHQVKNKPQFKQIRTPEGKKRFIIRHAENKTGKAFEDIAFDTYYSDHGEIEARESADRVELSDKQRKKNPIANDGIVFDEKQFEERMIDILQDLGYTKNQIYDFYKNGDFFNDELANVSQSARASESRAERSDAKRRGRPQETVWENAEYSRRVHGTVESRSNDAANSQASVRGLRFDDQIKYSISPETDSEYLSAQVKSAAPVTYDDNGNVIPLSERFDEGKNDIRWSISADLESEAEWTYNIPEPKYETADVSSNIIASEYSADKIDVAIEAAKKEYGLTEKEAFAIRYYVEGGAYNLTRTQRKNDRSDQSGYDSYIENLVREGLFKHPTYSGITYRNLDFDTAFNTEEDYADFLYKNGKGKVVNIDAFSSASKIPNGYITTGNKVVHLVIKGESARDISETFNEDQQEVIYLPGSKYLVVRVTTANDGNPLIYGKEITNNEVQQLQRGTGVSQSDRGIKTVSEGQKHDIQRVDTYGGIQRGTYSRNEKQSENANENISGRGSEEQAKGVKHSVSEEIEAESEASYEQLKRQLEKQKQKNKELAGELIRTHGKKLDPKAVKANLKDIIERYQGTVKPADVERKFQRAFEYVFNKKLVTYNEDGSLKSIEKVKELDLDVMTEMFQDMATDIFNSAVEYDDTYSEYRSLLKELRDTGITVSEIDRGGDFDDVGGWSTFRKKNFGNVLFVNDGLPIDSYYVELAENYPELFPDTITHPADQAKQIADVARTIRESGITATNIYGGLDAEMIINEIACDLYSVMKDTDRKETFADKAAKKVEDAHLAEKMHYGAKIAELKRKNERREKILTEKFESRAADRSEKQQKAYQNKMVHRRAKDLVKRLMRPTKTKHIPEAMASDVGAFLSKLTWSDRTQADIEFNAYINDLLVKAPKEFNDKPVENGFSEDLLGDLKDFNAKSIEAMTASETHELNELLRRMIHEVNVQDKVFHSTEKASVLASKAKSQFATARKERIYAGNKLINFIQYGAADPEAFFNALGIPVLTDAYHNLASRQNVFASTLRELTSDMRDIVNGKIPREWREEVKTFTTAYGQTVRLTPAKAMTIYLLSRQEASRKRLINERGGIVPTETKLGFSKVETDKNGKTRKNLSLPKTVLGKHANLTEGDLITIQGLLTKEQIDVANKISELLNGKCAELGNQVSLETEGYRKFIVENYFPMMVAENGKTFEQLVKDANTQIAHKSLTKDRTGTAGVPLVVDDIFNVVDRHILGMSQYYAYDKALRDFQRIFTLRPEGQSSLRLTMDEFFGNGSSNKVTTFINNFIKDVQGAQMATGEETLISEKVLSAYKAAQVAGNLSVVVKQPTAIFRAMPEFSAKGNAAMLKVATTKSDIKEMIEHSGLAQLKAWGFSENTTAKSVSELYDKNATNLRGKIGNVTSFLAEQADMITWAAIWRASKAETSSLAEATEKFNEVIRRTQVVKSAFTSSRVTQQSGVAKLAFAFKNEPLKTFNYMRSTVNDVIAGKEGAKKKAVWVAVTTALNTATVAAISAGFSLLRDDEEDSEELFLEKFKENVIADLISNSTIMLGDIWTAVESAVDRRTVERMDLAVFTDAAELAFNVWDMLNKPQSEQKNTWMKILYDSARTISNFTGIPIGNAMRAIKTLHGSIVELSDDPVARYNMTKIWYNVDGIDNSTVRTKFKSVLTDALDDGDYKAFEEIRSDLRAHGFSATDIQKAVANSTRLYEAWNNGAEAFRTEVNKAMKYAKTLDSAYVMEAFKSKKTTLVNDLYEAMKSGSKKATEEAMNALLKHRDVDTKRTLTDREVDKLIEKKIEKSISDEIEERLADLYGTDAYEGVKKKILNEYRHFDMITSEYIDKIARSMN